MTWIDEQSPLDLDHPINKGVILHWLNRPEAGQHGGAFIGDATGNPYNNGVFTGNVVQRGFPNRPGGKGYVACPVGADSMISGPVLLGMNSVPKLTMGCWFYRDVATQQYSFIRDAYGASSSVGLLVGGDGNAYFMFFSSGYVYGTVPNWTGAGWHRFDMVFDGAQLTDATRLKGYIDGVPQTLTGLSGVPTHVGVDTVNPIRFNRWNQSSYGYNSAYDDASISVNALSDAEVMWRYHESQKEFPSYFKSPTVAQAWLPPPPPQPHARRQIAVDQEPGGSNYPFILPSDNLEQLIADFYLQYKDDACDVRLPLRIVSLWNFGTTGDGEDSIVHEYDILIADANDGVVFDSRDANEFRVNTWGSDKKIIEWANTLTGEVCRAVIWTAWPPDSTPITWPLYLEPSEATLDPRTYERRPDALTSLIVEAVKEPPDIPEEEGVVVDNFFLSGSSLLIKPGFNYTIAAAESEEIDGGALRYIIDMSADPGTGEGRFTGCDEVDPKVPVHKINGVSADASGNLSLDARQCYRLGLNPIEVEGDKVLIDPSTILLTNNCGPCYTCDDFVLVYNALHRLYLQYKALGIRAETTRDWLQTNIERWEANRECRKGHVLRTSAMPLGMCRAGLGVAVCNNSDVPLQNVTLGIKLTTTAAGGLCLVSFSVFRKGNIDPTSALPPNQMQPYQLGGTFPGGCVASFDCIHPASLGTVVLQVEAQDATDSDTITMELEATDGIIAVPKTQTIGIRCSSFVNPAYCMPPTTTPGQMALFSMVSKQLIDEGGVSKIIPDQSGNAMLVLPYGDYQHTLRDGSEINIIDMMPATYTGKHRVTKVSSPRVLNLMTKFVGEANGGRWFKV